MAAARGGSFVVLGAVVTSIGIGLAPYLAKDSVSVGSLVAVAAVVGGLVAVVRGARAVLRGRRWWTITAGVIAVVVVLAVTTAVVAPAIAATSVPPTEVSTRPEDLGMTSVPVTLDTSDGIHLAAWFIRGTNGAGVVVLHGAGSTRSSTLAQASVLAGAGYTVLLLDARGHGESDGQAMDFGWFGDRDVAAGTAYLAAVHDVDPARIGVVGFSMGGEEAIGAAGSNALVRAVVAEGATGRTAADKAWLSDTWDPLESTCRHASLSIL